MPEQPLNKLGRKWALESNLSSLDDHPFNSLRDNISSFTQFVSLVTLSFYTQLETLFGLSKGLNKLLSQLSPITNTTTTVFINKKILSKRGTCNEA